MSSHHIVRENQEPALIILDELQLQRPIINELLEWSPKVIVCEKALSNVLAWGIKIDVVILSDNNDYHLQQLVDQEPIEVIFSKNGNVLKSVIDFIVDKQLRAVNLLIPDQTWLDDLQILDVDITIVAFHKNKKWSLVRRNSFEKWLAEGTSLFTYPIKKYLTEGLTADFTTIKSGQVKIESDGTFWIGENVE